MINLGRAAEARRPAQEAIALARASNDRAALGRALGLGGFALLYDGDSTGAHVLFREARTIATRENRERDTAVVARGYAELALAEEDPEEALTQAFTALDLFDRLDDARAGAWQRCQVAHALLLVDRPTEALWYAESSLRALREAQLPLIFLEALFVTAAILIRLRLFGSAVVLLRHAHAREIALAPFRVSPLIERLTRDAEANVRRELSDAELTHLGNAGEALNDEDIIALLRRR